MRWIRSACHFLLAAAVCSLGAAGAFAQSTNAGDVRGTVTDPSGAVIPGVTVTVLNVDTGVSKDFTTNHDGVYDTASIIAGSYQITFAKEGFGKLSRGPITVEVGATTVNATLKVGSETVEVNVNTDVPLLHTEGGDQTTILEAKDMDQLPNVGGSNGPDWQNFMILLPGATGTYAGSSNNANAFNPGQTIATNGNMPFNNVLQDGASTTLPSSQNANPATFEDVQELQVATSSFSAQYGVGGLIINQITKSGTDKFHGVAYEYFQNNALNAANYGFGNKETVPFLRYDDFGGTFSGPVALPFLNLRHKAFFFFGYDQIINNGVSAGFNTIPTPAVMSGDFTGGYTIYDPTTQTVAVDGAGNPYPVRKSFLEEYGTNAIPAAMIDKVSANLQQFYPTATSHIPYGSFETPQSTSPAGVQNDNFYSQYPIPRPWKRYFGRLDYDVSPNNRVTLSDTQGNELENGDNPVSACPIGCQIGDVDNNNAQITDVWNISQRTVNEARMGFTDQLNFFQDAGTGTGLPAKLGWQFAKADVLPSLQFTRNYPYAWIEPATNASYKEFTFDPSDVVTMIRGKHIIHFGGEFAFYRDDATSWGNINAGTLQFSGQYTENWTLSPKTLSSGQTIQVASPNSQSGEEYADFLLGYANNWSASVTPEFGARLKKPQLFIQDDIKLRPNFTLNVGVRYEISHGFNEVKGNEDSFDPTIVNPATNTKGAQWFGSTHVNGRNALQADVYTSVLPRAGFSWLMFPTTTFRGGFGLYTYNFSLDNYGSGMGSAFGASGGYGDQSNGIYPVTKFDGTGTLFPLGGGTVAPLPYTSASTSPTRFNGQGTNYNDFHTPIPKIYQWNLGIEQQIMNNTAVTLSYVASHGFNLTFPTNINAPSEANLSSNNASTCGSGISSATCTAQFPIYTSTGTNQGINGNLYEAISNYDSLQATITKRLSNGFSSSFNYVWSHMLDDQDSAGWGTHAGPTNVQHESTLQFNRAYLNYGPSNFDTRNQFKGYAVYDLPFGHGRQFFNKNWFADETIGGLQLSGTLVISSGNPFQVFADQPTYAGGSQYPDSTGISPIPVGGRTLANWYNPAAFSNPGPGNFGTVQRNPLVGPGFYTVNLSALKLFDLPWENIKFSIRADASNAFNHPSFGPPGGQLTEATGTTVPTGSAYNAITNGPITGIQIGGRTVQVSARLAF